MSDDTKGHVNGDAVQAVYSNVVGEQLEVIEKKPTYNHDLALDLFDGNEEEFEYTSREEGRLIWKLDLTLLPLVCHHVIFF